MNGSAASDPGKASRAAPRRAVVIGVSTFPPGRADVEVPAPNERGFDPLEFVPERTDKLVSKLKWSGFDVTAVLEPGRDRLLEAVRDCTFDQTAPSRIVHIISHGVPGHRGRVDAVPSDGKFGTSETDVATWISDAYGRGPTLFLVDLCFAGRAVDQEWLRESDVDTRTVHVIAAANQKAYGGVFTDVLADVIELCGQTGLGTDSSREYVDLEAFARVVMDATDKRSGSRQRIAVSTLLGARNAELPFFRNPNYLKDRPIDQLRLAVHPDLLPFLDDPAAGAEFFADRVGRHFTGRSDQLDVLMPWIRGGPGPTVRVVTGGPGSGKSALLGAVVCASHPMLHAVDAAARADGSRLQAVRYAGDYEPRIVQPFASIHARQRRLDDVVASVGRQLGLPSPDGGWSAPQLILAIAELPEPPTIVIDALDESVEPEDVEAVLLLPLASCLERTGGRLLVGVRPWREVFRDLFELADGHGSVIDLDLVDQRVLARDLAAFVRAILDDSRRFGGRGQVDSCRRLAHGIAERLARLPRGPGRSGAFLVARLYAEHLGVQDPDVLSVPVSELLDQIPTSLPEVLELDLRGKPDPAALRATLAVLALAHGEGMPWEQARALLDELERADDADYHVSPQAPPEDIQFYLRTSLDATALGTTLYRLFHQSLVDYLTEHPMRPPGEETR